MRGVFPDCCQSCYGPSPSIFRLCSLKLIKSMLLFCTCMIQKLFSSLFADDRRIARNIFK